MKHYLWPVNPHFDSLNRFFDRIYVLTIPAATQRQEALSQAMQGLNTHFFYGIEKQTISLDRLQQDGVYDETLTRHHQRYGKPMTTGEVACAMGHRAIYEDIVANGVQKALIFEDDVFPLTDNLPHVPAMLTTIPPDWDILFFDYHKHEKPVPLKRAVYHVQHALGLLKWNHTMIGNLFPKPVNEHWKTAGFHDFADAYAVTHAAAKKLATLQTPVSAVADNLLARAVTQKQLNGYVSVPKLFAQRSEGQYKSIDTLVDKPVREV